MSTHLWLTANSVLTYNYRRNGAKERVFFLTTLFDRWMLKKYGLVGENSL